MLSGLLFASGLSALIYQVLWTKQLTLILGTDVVAMTASLSAFVAGVGGGNFFFGRYVDTVAKPLLLYAVLEIATALCGVATTLVLAHGTPLIVAIENAIGWPALILPLLLVTISAALMGGTLPTIIRVSSPDTRRISRTCGSLFSAKTGGAMAGSLLSSFVFIPRFGIIGSAIAAASINALLTLIALVAGREQLAAQCVYKHACVAPSLKIRAIALYAATGCIAFGYQVVWSQTSPHFIGTRGFTSSIMLATYFCGLMLGSALYAHLSDRARDPWGAFSTLISATGLTALLQIAALGMWLPTLQDDSRTVVLALTKNHVLAAWAPAAIASISILFIPTILLGAALPAAMRLIVDESHIGRDAGLVLACNAFGGIAGTLLTSFVIIPSIGLIHTLETLSALAFIIGLCALCINSSRFIYRAVFFALVISLVFAFSKFPTTSFVRIFFETDYEQQEKYEKKAGSASATMEGGSASNNAHPYIGAISNPGDGLPSMRHTYLQILLPLMIQRNEPNSAFIIASCAGVAAAALTHYPGLERRVCAEPFPGIAQTTRRRNNYSLNTDQLFARRVRDGRSELLFNTDRYDLIALETPPPSAAGVVNYYSINFYQIARSRLTDSGFLAQRLPIGIENNEDTRALVRSFLAAFPYATLWTTELQEMVLLGSAVPIELDSAQIGRRFYRPEVANVLHEVGIDSPSALLATWMMGRSGLEKYAGDFAPVTDDYPSVEYSDLLRPGEFARALPQLLALKTSPPLVAGDAAEEAVKREREHLLLLYEAALQAYRSDYDASAKYYKEALEQNSENAHHR